jgi:nickel/cobalt transporter (NicO) family protein
MMIDLKAALEAGDLTILVWVALALGFLHTILGPDHYLPFVMMAKAQKWSRKKTAFITALCGLGHVASSVVIGCGLALAGMHFGEWESSSWASWHGGRGSLAAWLLMGLGVAFVIWGLIRVMRGRTHTHAHLCGDGSSHSHAHDHSDTHMHLHASPVKKMTPWVLFTIFVFGPCESLIPLMLAAWAIAGFAGSMLIALCFSAVTVATIVGTVWVLQQGVDRIPLGKMDRWSTTLAGVSLVFCGAAIQWLGL